MTATWAESIVRFPLLVRRESSMATKDCGMGSRLVETSPKASVRGTSGWYGSIGRRGKAVNKVNVLSTDFAEDWAEVRADCVARIASGRSLPINIDNESTRGTES